MALSLADRVWGCFLGGALGDAIGSSFEGCEPFFEFVIPTRLRISDDTQLTMATCESILEMGEVIPQSIDDHFVRWYRNRRISGVGSSTLKALTELDVGGHWALVGARGDRAAGNGAAMRIAPLAFCLDPDTNSQRQTIRDVCRITHHNDEAYGGALAIVLSIRYVLSGGLLDANLFQYLSTALPDSGVRDRLIEITKTSITVAEYGAKFGSSGHVVDSVPLAILAAVNAEDFTSTIESLARLGGDTDTNASLFGQIFGAARGPSMLPFDLMGRIDRIEEVRNSISNFLTQIA